MVVGSSAGFNSILSICVFSILNRLLYMLTAAARSAQDRSPVFSWSIYPNGAERREASPRVALGLMQRHGGRGVCADALALRCAPGFGRRDRGGSNELLMQARVCIAPYWALLRSRGYAVLYR